MNTQLIPFGKSLTCDINFLMQQSDAVNNRGSGISTFVSIKLGGGSS